MRGGAAVSWLQLQSRRLFAQASRARRRPPRRPLARRLAPRLVVTAERAARRKADQARRTLGLRTAHACAPRPAADLLGGAEEALSVRAYAEPERERLHPLPPAGR